MIVGISQSNYIPWQGYFDLIKSCDVFVLYDVVQFTKNDWRNRNKITTNKKTHWLSIPVNQLKLSQSIIETHVANSNWNKQHWKSISQAYSQSPKFKEISNSLEELYLNKLESIKSLSLINEITLKWWLEYLSIDTKIISAQSLNSAELLPLERSERLLKVCKDLNASVYLTQPMAKSYLNTHIFENSDIKVNWMKYDDYPNTNSIVDVAFSK